ncbi:hypothetical protein ON010_g14559 [Phytophthora cinnamomi]|nr:hypothetical protein ON010_g14559 [Phytophthora cinnamomi]
MGGDLSVAEVRRNSSLQVLDGDPEVPHNVQRHSIIGEDEHEENLQHQQPIQKSGQWTISKVARVSTTYQVHNKLGDLGHELQVEEVRELVGPGPVHPGVQYVQHVTQEGGNDRHQQNQELVTTKQSLQQCPTTRHKENMPNPPQNRRG